MRLAVLITPYQYGALAFVRTLSPSQLTELCAAGRLGLYIPWREMTPQQQAIARDAQEALVRYRQTVAKEYPPDLEQAQRILAEFGICLYVNLTDGRPTFLQLDVPGGHTNFSLGPPVVRPNRLRTEPDQVRPARRNPYSQSAVSGQQSAVSSRPSPAERPESPNRRAAQTELETKPFPARGFRQQVPSVWPQVFRQLSERLPLALYSDSYPSTPFRPMTSTESALLPLEKMSIAEALDALCTRHDRVWWQRGDALFFRSRTWFLDKRSTLPAPLRQQLDERLRANQRLDAGVLDQLATLTFPQLYGFSERALEQRGEGWGGWNRDFAFFWVLRAYDALSPAQRQRALAEPGVSLGELTPLQRERLRGAILMAEPRRLDLVDGALGFWFRQNVTAEIPRSTLAGFPGKPFRMKMAFMVREPGGSAQVSAETASFVVPFVMHEERRPDESAHRESDPSVACGMRHQ
jgi:hypothetical protein